MSPQNLRRPSIECRCQGSPTEMGLAQGRALRGRIAELRRRLRNMDAFRLEQPVWLPYPLYLRLAELKLQKALVPALRRDDPVMLARLQGIAQGAGLPLRSLALLNAIEALLGSTEGRTVPGLSGGCSALAVRGSRSRTGEPILVKNFDYLPLAQPFYILRESRPAHGWRSLDFAVAPQAGTVDGVNEAGLGITLNYAFMTDHGPTGVPNGASPCVHTDYWRTTACLQWFPARRCVRVSYSTACEADFVEIALA